MTSAPVRVLVVEDNPGDAKLLEFSLSHEPGGPYPVEHVDRVAAAVHALATHPFDAVFLDLGLPDSRGIDGIRRVRDAAPGAAVVVLSGSEDPEVVRRSIVAGADDFREKGLFPVGVLGPLLALAIDRHRLERDLAAPKDRESIALRLEESAVPSAVAEAGIVLAQNSAFLECTGDPTADLATDPSNPVSQVVARIARDLEATTSTTDGPVPRAHGPFLPDDASLDLAELEYVASTVRRGPPHRVLVTLRRAVTYAPAWTKPEPKASAAAPSASRPAIDAAAWQDLVSSAGGDSTFLADLVDTYLREASTLAGEMERAASVEDLGALARAAHSLKSSSGELAAVDLARRCAAVEREAGAGEGEKAVPHALDAVREFGRVRDDLRRRRPTTTE